MILATAEAEVDEKKHELLLGAWSNMMVGTKPEGLVECFLLRGENVWQVKSIWESEEAQQKAHDEEGIHPAYAVFEALGSEPVHSVVHVVGRFKA